MLIPWENTVGYPKPWTCKPPTVNPLLPESKVVKIIYNCLDDILKQLATRRSLKEQHAQNHKNTRTQEHKNTEIFLGETTREKTPQNFLSIELNHNSVKP